MSASPEESDASFLKGLAIGLGICMAGGFVILNICKGVADKVDAGDAALNRYVRTHRCVVAYETQSRAQLYRCDDVQESRYVEPAGLRAAAMAEMVRVAKH